MKSFKKKLLLLLLIIPCFFLFPMEVQATEETQIVSDVQTENTKPFEELPAIIRKYKNENTKSVNVREQASISSNILITLPVGEHLTVVDQMGEWFEVRYNDISGYVFWKYIGFIEPEITEESSLIANSIIHSTSSENRDTNISIACETINGLNLNPEEKFVWSNIIGQTTASKGYLTAGVIINKQSSLGLGGGVCQVSTTIYNALFDTIITPLEVNEHSIGCSYAERDATVAHGYKDFIFKNTYNFPLRIETYSYKGIVFVNLYKAE